MAIFTRRREIDPAQLTDMDSRLLVQLLKDQQHKPVLHAGDIYLVKLPGTTRKWQVSLTHDLVYRKNRKGEPRFSVMKIDPHNAAGTGVGANGSVYHVNSTLAPQQNGRLVNKTTHARVIKKIDHEALDESEEYIDPPNLLEREIRISQDLPHLNLKEITVEQDQQGNPKTNYLVMDEFKNTDLEAIMHADREGNQFQVLPLNERIQLTLLLLRALQEQIHDFEVIHRDLKPENIRVNIDTGEIGMIDFGYATKFKDPKYFMGGNLSYLPIDVNLNGWPNHPQAEVYSMGLILRELWRADDRGIAKKGIDKDKLLALFAEGIEPASMDKLFTGIEHEIDPQNQDQIRNILAGLTDRDQNRRLTLDEAIAGFHKIRLGVKIGFYKMSNKADFDFKKLTQAQVVALETYTALRKIARSDSPERENHLLRTLSEGLAKIDDHTYTVTEFLDVLQIRAFKNLTTKSQVLEKRIEIFSAFDSNLESFSRLSEQVRVNINGLNSIAPLVTHLSDKFNKVRRDLEKCLRDIDVLYAREREQPLTIDNMMKLNTSFQKEYVRLNNELNTLQSSTLMGAARAYKELSSALMVEEGDDPMVRLKNRIKERINYYIQTTLTPATFEKSDRASSARRLQDMRDILQIVNSANDWDSLNASLSSRLRNIQTGFFGRSLLRSQIKETLRGGERLIPKI